MKITLSLSVANAHKVLEFVETLEPTLDTVGPIKISELNKPIDPSACTTSATVTTTVDNALVPPLEPVASHTVGSDIHRTESVDEVTEVIEPAAEVDIQEVRAAVQQAVQRLDVKCTSGNSNSTGHIINKLDEICGCKKVTDIPVGRYADVIDGLATLGV